MKKQYLFLRENADLHSSSVIYHVWIGESERDQECLAECQQYATQHHCTFRQWSEDIDYWLDYEADRVFGSMDLLIFGFARVDLSIVGLRDLCRHQCWESFESRSAMTTQLFTMMAAFRPDLTHKIKNRSVTHSVLAEPRKNLSHRIQSDQLTISFI